MTRQFESQEEYDRWVNEEAEKRRRENKRRCFDSLGEYTGDYDNDED